MGLNFLKSSASEKAVSVEKLPSALYRSLVLIRERDCLAAVIVSRSLRGRSIEALFRAPLGSGLREALIGLKKECEENGLADVWRRGLKICLPADEALFQDFQLPPSSISKAKKTVPLLLDGELPFDEAAFSYKTTFARRKGLFAVTTIAPDTVFEKWREVLDGLETGDAEISFFPWPIISALPPLKEAALVACLESDECALCALDAKGVPLRIRQMPFAREEKAAENFARRARLLFSDLGFSPGALFIFGDYHLPGLKNALSEEFESPCLALGKDIPLGGQYERLGEDDSARLLAMCLESRKIIPAFEKPVFRLKFNRPFRFRSYPIAAVAASLVLLIGFEIYSLSSSLDNLNKAEKLRAMTSENIRKALGDAPKSASAGRLSSILNSRLRELELNGAKGEKREAVDFLEELHKACPPDLDIDIYRLAWDEKSARLNGRAKAYEDVDALKSRAESLDGVTSARIVNAATSQGDRKGALIEFELDLGRARR